MISGTLIVLSLISLALRGLEMGIDFQGGMEFVVENSEAIPTGEVRSALTNVLGAEPEVKTYGPTALLIRTASAGDINEVEAQLIRGLDQAFPNVTHRIEKRDMVGPRFAEDLKKGALYSILGALVVIFLYIWIRFQWKVGFSVGAVAALIHDVVITLGMFSVLHHLDLVPFSLQIDQTIIAAFLTIVGYSINDTVVVFDRIREYTTMFKTELYESVVNRSINSTLSRTVITSGTTLLVVITLFIFGSEVLRGFAFALAFGITIGTYSSIFVAAPIVVEMRNRGARR
jgi:preprotein translocase SecF subunit